MLEPVLRSPAFRRFSHPCRPAGAEAVAVSGAGADETSATGDFFLKKLNMVWI
jgi:hypothetical protein